MAVVTDKTGQRHEQPTVGARQSSPLEGFLPFFRQFLAGNLVNPDNIPPCVYRRMQETDETVSAGIDFIQLTVTAHLGRYINPNRRAQAYIDELWWHCHSSLEQVVEEILQALVFGWSVGEKVLRAGVNRIWLDDIPFLAPESTTIAIEGDPGAQGFGRVTGFSQRSGFDAELPLSKMVYYAHRVRNSNVYGQSRLKPAYKSWVLKDVLLKDYGLAMSTYGSPIGVGQVQNLHQQELDDDGSITTSGKRMLKTLKGLSGGSAVVHGPAESISLEQAKISVGKDFKEAEDHLNKCILRAMLIPALLFEPTDIGSFALGNKHFEIFMRSIGRIVKDVQRVVLLQIYQPLLWINFGLKVPLGRFESIQLEEEDLKLWSEIYSSLVTHGFLSDQEADDVNAVRARFNLAPAKVLTRQELRRAS